MNRANAVLGSLESTNFEVPVAEPASSGFLAERLGRIALAFNAEVATAEIPGAVMLVARHGQLAYAGTFGWRDPVARSPMTVDTLFRLASMTKPVVSVAAMILVEEGHLQLGDPVSKYLPELKNRQVAIGTNAAANDTAGLQPATREMTVQDLMRHTSGFTYGEFGTSPLHQVYARADLLNLTQSSAEFVSKLARLPLLHQPGTTFEYGVSTDVLGRIIEVVSGLELDRYIDERIATPLNLPSFSFQITEADAPRLARAMPGTADDAGLNDLNQHLRKQRWISGGGGLNGNALDYLRFAQMLLNGGELDGVRILSPKTVSLMTSDALAPDVRYGEYAEALGSIAPTAAMGQGFGLGLTIRTVPGRNPLPGSPGDYSWAGSWGTYFWVDPAEELACVLLMQARARRAHFRALARTLVYQAMHSAGSGR